MKKLLSVAVISILSILLSCGQKSHDHDDHSQPDGEQDSGNQALYDDVMKVHDEVMPKMNDIYKLREQLKKQVSEAPDMVAEKKKKIESTIIKLDSASEEMMVWMRNFNPLPDSLGGDSAREYLEKEKVKVNQVKDDMLKAIEEAKSIN